MCFGAASVSADVGTAPEVHHVAVAVAATPPSPADPPHVAERDFLTHILGAEIAAGGGTVVQGIANLEGEGSLEAGGAITAGASLSGSGTLIAGGAIAPAADLQGEGHIEAGGTVVPAAQLSGSGSLTACLTGGGRASARCYRSAPGGRRGCGPGARAPGGWRDSPARRLSCRPG